MSHNFPSNSFFLIKQIDTLIFGTYTYEIEKKIYGTEIFLKEMI